jgi:hypothetical protein
MSRILGLLLVRSTYHAVAPVCSRASRQAPAPIPIAHHHPNVHPHDLPIPARHTSFSLHHVLRRARRLSTWQNLQRARPDSAYTLRQPVYVRGGGDGPRAPADGDLDEHQGAPRFLLRLIRPGWGSGRERAVHPDSLGEHELVGDFETGVSVGKS